MKQNFYDKIAKKFGEYRTGAKSTKVATQGSEDLFKDKLFELALPGDKVALDIGCADGRFTILAAPHFKQIFAIDNSVEMLAVAQSKQVAANIGNIIFENKDVFDTDYPENFFDVVYSRRGPSPFMESYRILKVGGFYIEIGIGEKDCMDIKKIFGRGQDYGTWDQSRLEQKKQALIEAGFEIIFEKNIFYDEYYAAYQDLNLFLQGVPIFEDFDPVADEARLGEYVAQFKNDQGIRLPRHRVLVIAQK